MLDKSKWICETCGCQLNLDGFTEENDYDNPAQMHEFYDTKENGYKHHLFCEKHAKEYMKSWKMSRLLGLIDDMTDKLCWDELEWAKSILLKKIEIIEKKDEL